MISIQRNGSIASILLDRPATRNALDCAGWRALAHEIGEVGRSGARVLILRSANEAAFSAGSDLNELADLAGDEAARPAFRSMMRDAIDGLAELPIATIAAIDGNCFGAAVALALGCDIRVAGAGARFAITPAKLGIGFPHEDVERLVAAIGQGQAARLLFTAQPIDAEEAARIGLVELVCPSSIAQAEQMAEAIAANSRASIALLKAMLQRRAGKSESDAAFDGCFGEREFAERLAAFRSGRSAVNSPRPEVQHSPSPD